MTSTSTGASGDSARLLDVEMELAAPWLADARIMVVDDDEGIVHLVSTVLRMAGAVDVQGVTDPRQAVRACRERRPNLLVLDLHMGVLVDGLDVLAALGADSESITVVVLSGDTNPDARMRALQLGAADFIAKPFDVVELVRRLRLLLESRATHSSHR